MCIRQVKSGWTWNSPLTSNCDADPDGQSWWGCGYAKLPTTIGLYILDFGSRPHISIIQKNHSLWCTSFVVFTPKNYLDWLITPPAMVDKGEWFTILALTWSKYRFYPQIRNPPFPAQSVCQSLSTSCGRYVLAWGPHLTKASMELGDPLVICYITMENGQFIDGLPIKHGDFP